LSSTGTSPVPWRLPMAAYSPMRCRCHCLVHRTLILVISTA
jgi:hypothetical protein